MLVKTSHMEFLRKLELFNKGNINADGKTLLILVLTRQIGF